MISLAVGGIALLLIGLGVLIARRDDTMALFVRFCDVLIRVFEKQAEFLVEFFSLYALLFGVAAVLHYVGAKPEAILQWLTGGLLVTAFISALKQRYEKQNNGNGKPEEPAKKEN